MKCHFHSRRRIIVEGDISFLVGWVRKEKRKKGKVEGKTAPHPIVCLSGVHKVLDNGRIGQGGDVSYLVHLLLGDLAQDPAHDLSRASLG